MRTMRALLLVAVVSVLYVGCDEAGTNAGDATAGTIRLQMYSAVFAPDDLTPDLELEPIVHISPAIDGRDVFVGDGAGTILIDNVPAGSYTVHPVFFDSANDITVEVTTGTVTEDSIVLPETGLYYYLVNVGSDTEPLQDATVRGALAAAMNRGDIVASHDFADADPTLAFDLIPPELKNDGITDLTTVTESVSDAQDSLSSTPAFSFELLYNTVEDDVHEKLANEFKQQVESLTAVTGVSLRVEDFDTYLDTRATFDFEVARAGWILDANNLDNYLEILVDQAGLEDDDITAKIDEAEAALEAGSLTDYAVAVIQLHDLILAQMIAIPIYFY